MAEAAVHREEALLRVGLLHGVFVLALVTVLATLGQPVRGAALGGGLMALSFVLLWAMGRSLVSRREGLLPLLALAKISLYLGLAAAVLTGRLVADGTGFAAGVTCFLAAAVAAAVFRPDEPGPG